jgi:hypothetical protein
MAAIVESMQAFVPDGILINFDNVKTREDLRFPVFRRDMPATETH